MPDSSMLPDGEDLESVTLDSFEIFEKCVLELCGIKMTGYDLDAVEEARLSLDSVAEDTDGADDHVTNEDIDGADDNITPLPDTVDTIGRLERKILLADGGKALFRLGKYCDKCDWDSDAMQFYKHALYLYFLDLDVEEPRLLDNSDDCDGLFYIQCARVCVNQSSPAHQQLGMIFRKMGDIHGKNKGEENDALLAYRAARVFWNKVIEDSPVKNVEDCKNANDYDKLSKHLEAVEGLALTFNRIGGVYTSKGDLQSALTAFHEALDIQIETLGCENLEVAKIFHNIGVCHRHSDNWDEALEYYQYAFGIFEHFLGRDHLDTVRTLQEVDIRVHTTLLMTMIP